MLSVLFNWRLALLTSKHPLNFPAILNDTKLRFPSFSDLTLIQPHESLSRQWKSRNKREMLAMKDIFVFVTLAASIQGKKKSMQFIAWWLFLYWSLAWAIVICILRGGSFPKSQFTRLNEWGEYFICLERHALGSGSLLVTIS